MRGTDHPTAPANPDARRRTDLVAQGRGHTLVGVDAQHPVMARSIDGELLLRRMSGPIAFHHPRAQRRGALARRIAGVRVDDHDLVAPGERGEALVDALRFIERDHAGADGHTRRGRGRWCRHRFLVPGHRQRVKRRSRAHQRSSDASRRIACVAARA